MPQLILASGSSARKQLLDQAGYEVDAIMPQDVDETPFKGEMPRDYVKRITKAKFEAAVQQNSNDIIISADTIPVTGRRIFQKPETSQEAYDMLQFFSGRRIKVMTCVYVGKALEVKFRLVLSSCKIKKLSDQEIESWVSTKDWVGVSGGIKLQGLSSIFIESIQGSFTNIVGLPMTETYNLLKYFGVLPKWQKK
jgi:septum formation protein